MAWGAFRPDKQGRFRFLPQVRPRSSSRMQRRTTGPPTGSTTISSAAASTHGWTTAEPFPGQNWPRAIEQAISVSDFFVACFSERSGRKRGNFQSELRYALDCATLLPLEQVYFIPVRIEECRVPARITREFQYVDLFPNWESGFQKILTAVRKQLRAHGPAAA